jgi:hypothetical protein
MNEKEERARLRSMLMDLISQQDSITHLNERGREFEQQTRELIEERGLMIESILDYTMSLVDAKQPRPVAIPPSCEGLGWSHGGW